MQWQDYVFTVGSFLLIVTLIPMLRSKHGAPVWSALPIAAILFVFAATYLTLGFKLAPTIEAVQATLWVYLAWQHTTRTRQASK